MKTKKFLISQLNLYVKFELNVLFIFLVNSTQVPSNLTHPVDIPHKTYIPNNMRTVQSQGDERHEY